MANLKRCPLCGCEKVEYFDDSGCRATMFAVLCQDCGAQTAFNPSEAQAAEEWNRRAIEHELEVEIGRLRDALYSLTGWHNLPLDLLTNDDLITAAIDHKELYAETVAIKPTSGVSFSDEMMQRIDKLTVILAEESADPRCWNCFEKVAADQCSKCGEYQSGDPTDVL